ncbi:MAG: hypothetical protein ACRC6I_03160, partial [Paracoccaceae bacterium]
TCGGVARAMPARQATSSTTIMPVRSMLYPPLSRDAHWLRAAVALLSHGFIVARRWAKSHCF